ncbi:MAG TPA: carboxypeptidase-like regulatory domain-containing protein [Ignavibacteria bacterium]|jgi:hypothetical protein
MLKKHLLFILLLVLLIFSNDLFGQVIRGKLLDEKGFPLSDVSIIISNGGSTITGSDGSFTISATKTPYDLLITDASNNTGALYRGLYSTNPEIILFGNYLPRNVNSEAIKVEFPPVPRDRSAIIKFVSNDLFYSEEVTAFTNEKSKTITVNWLANTSTISGKIIYLEKSSESFEKFSERSYTVIKDFYPQSVKFDSSTSYINTGDANLTVYLPQTDYSKKGFRVSADFLALHRNSEMNLITVEGDIIYTKCSVPLSIPYGFRFKVYGYANNNDGSGFENTTYAYPNSVMTIQSETPPKLTAPQDKFYGVNTSTEFGYEWGSGLGLYVIHFHCISPAADFYVVTKEKFISSPFAYAGGILTGDEYTWNVSKYMTYITVDEFVKERRFLNDVGYRAVTQSETRTFRKRPY